MNRKEDLVLVLARGAKAAAAAEDGMLTSPY